MIQRNQLQSIGINSDKTNWNTNPSDSVKHTIEVSMGTLSENGTLAINTGAFTGRSPKDRFIVKDQNTDTTVWWGDINIPMTTENFEGLWSKATTYANERELWVRDAFACADENNRMSLRTICELPWSDIFSHNMFIRPTTEQLSSFSPEWNILCLPGFESDPTTDGTRQKNFAAISFTHKRILIGGTGYTGEIKKGIFSVLNYILPHEKNVLSMHCSANVGEEGDTAIFFGLSGTGKTTLSSDPKRRLIGDDEHGWSNDGIFNFEGGCYAKVIDISREKEQQIYDAIRPGALLENVEFHNGSNQPDYSGRGITENTRVSYPIHHIDNIVVPSTGVAPKNVFFLTADAFGVLPPISRLTKEQAMYHFMSGYTAKVAGTEMGVTEPTTTFSACFGKAFLPLHPAKYAEMLGEKLNGSDIKVWLVNTGWTGGPYGIGNRMKLSYTRAMITAAIEGKLDNVVFDKLPVFNLSIPTNCEGVPSEILNPRNTWSDVSEYDRACTSLANEFVENFRQFQDGTSEDILSAAPKTDTIYEREIL